VGVLPFEAIVMRQSERGNRESGVLSRVVRLGKEAHTIERRMGQALSHSIRKDLWFWLRMFRKRADQ
jgi:hypothetical protein